MNPRQRFLDTVNNRNFGSPIFCPAIYDYKVNFSDIPLHLFGQHEFELLDAVTNEINWLRSEVVTCAYDIWNVEAEALGAKVVRQQDIFPEVTTPLVNHLDEIDALPALNAPTGRMATFVKATKYLNLKYQNRIYIRGAVSGPLSLAGRIYPKDRLIADAMTNPGGARRLMEFCTDWILTYIDAFLTAGQDVVVVDSFAATPLVPPEMYSELVLPYHRKIFSAMVGRGAGIRPLIMGGDTRAIMDHLLKTGANQLLLDYMIPMDEVIDILDRYHMAFQINIDPAIVAQKDQDIIADQLNLMMSALDKRANVLIGTGILTKNTPLKNIIFIRDLIKSHFATDYTNIK